METGLIMIELKEICMTMEHLVFMSFLPCPLPKIPEAIA